MQLRFYRVTDKSLAKKIVEHESERSRIHKERLKFCKKVGASGTAYMTSGDRFFPIWRGKKRPDLKLWKELGSSKGHPYCQPKGSSKAANALVVEMAALATPSVHWLEKAIKYNSIAVRHGSLSMLSPGCHVTGAGSVFLYVDSKWVPGENIGVKRISDLKFEQVLRDDGVKEAFGVKL